LFLDVPHFVDAMGILSLLRIVLVRGSLARRMPDVHLVSDLEPVGPAERLWRWGRRNPLVAGLLATLASVLMAGFTVMAVLWARAERNATLAETNEGIARANELKATALARNEAKARADAQEQEKTAMERAEALAGEDYINRVNRAYREVQDDNVARAEDLQHGCPRDRRGWEWHFVERLWRLRGIMAASRYHGGFAVSWRLRGGGFAVSDFVSCFPGSRCTRPSTRKREDRWLTCPILLDKLLACTNVRVNLVAVLVVVSEGRVDIGEGYGRPR
jgi:hypothetical protein